MASFKKTFIALLPVLATFAAAKPTMTRRTDGSCSYGEPGCTNSEGSKYTPLANWGSSGSAPTDGSDSEFDDFTVTFLGEDPSYNFTITFPIDGNLIFSPDIQLAVKTIETIPEGDVVCTYFTLDDSVVAASTPARAVETLDEAQFIGGGSCDFVFAGVVEV